MKNEKIYRVSVILIGLIVLFFYFKNEKVYISKEYSSSGKLIGTNEYVLRKGEVIMHGKFVNYNGKGIKISEGQFVDNEPNGICSYYYDNGKIKSVSYRKNSKIDLETIYYNQNGYINQYTLYDNFGKTAFIIKYNNKVVSKYNGYSLLPKGQYKIVNKKQYETKTGDVLKVGDLIKYEYLLANTPYAKKTFKIENLGIDNTKIKRIIKKNPPTGIDVEEVLTKKGINTIRIIVQYEFNDKVTPVIKDTISFDINVK